MKQTNMFIKLPQAKVCNFMPYFRLGKEEGHQNNRKWITNSKWKAMQKPECRKNHARVDPDLLSYNKAILYYCEGEFMSLFSAISTGFNLGRPKY